MPANISPHLSRKFKFWSFASMVMVVFVHGYNLNQRYLQSATIVNEKLTLNTFIQYFSSNGLFRFFIPMLFIISGYLFALQDDQPYKQRINKRLRTLLLPYLIWSAVGLLFTWALEMSSYGRGIILETHLAQMSGNRILLHSYTWYELLFRWLLLPVSYQLWFVRVLFIYNLAYPALRWCVIKAPKIFFPLIILLWLANFGTLIVEAEGLFFFSLGIWMQKRNFDMEKPAKWLNPLTWGIVFVTLAAIKTILAFKGYSIMGNAVFPVIHIMYKIVVFSGLIAAWFCSNRVVEWCMSRKWFLWLTSFSFFIYVAHAPLVSYAVNMVFPLINHIPDYRLLCYFLLPVAILILCIIVGALIKTLSPKFFAILTGGR